MDLKDPESMADQLRALIQEQGLRERLVKAGNNRLRQLETTDRVEVLRQVVEDFRRRRLCWA